MPQAPMAGGAPAAAAALAGRCHDALRGYLARRRPRPARRAHLQRPPADPDAALIRINLNEAQVRQMEHVKLEALEALVRIQALMQS